MMKLLLSLLTVLVLVSTSSAQTVRAKQFLTTGGQGSVMQPPSMTTAQRNASSHQNGEIIYCTDCSPVGSYLYTNGSWVFISTAQAIFNVVDYGAKGDNVTNDSAAIQAAISAAASAAGGIVYIPPAAVPGNCYRAGMLQLKNNVYVVGAGKGASCVKAPDNLSLTSTNGSTLDTNGHYGLSVFTNVLSWDQFVANSARSLDTNNSLYLIAKTGVLALTINGNGSGQTGVGHFDPTKVNSDPTYSGNWNSMTSCVGLFNVDRYVIQETQCIDAPLYPYEIGFTNQGGSDHGKIYDNEALTMNPFGVGFAMITGKFNEFRGNRTDTSAGSFDQEPNIANEVARSNWIHDNNFPAGVRIQAPFASNIMTDMVLENNVIGEAGPSSVATIIVDHDTTGGLKIIGNRITCNGSATQNYAIQWLQSTSSSPMPARLIKDNQVSGCNYFIATSAGAGVVTSPNQNIQIIGNSYSGKYFLHLPVPNNVLVKDNIAVLSGGANAAQAIVINTGAQASYPTIGNVRFSGNIITGSGVTSQLDFQTGAGWTDTNLTPDKFVFEGNTFDVVGNAAHPFLFPSSVTLRNNTFRQITATMTLSATGYVLEGNLCYDNGSPPAIVTPANCFGAVTVTASPATKFYNSITGAPYTVGDLLFATSGGELSSLVDVAVGSILKSGGAATAPAYSTSLILSGANHVLGNTTTTAQIGLNVRDSITAAAGGAVLIGAGGSTLTAAANSDKLMAVGPDFFNGNIVFAKGALSGLIAAGVYLGPASWTSTGAGTIATAAGIYINDDPTIGSANYGLYNKGTTRLDLAINPNINTGIGVAPDTRFGTLVGGTYTSSGSPGVGLRIGTALTGSPNTDVYGLQSVVSLITPSSGTTPNAIGLYAATPTITVTGGSGLTNAYTVYIGADPTGAATDNIALKVVGSTVLGSPTGGGLGAGKINAAGGYYLNNSLLLGVKDTVISTGVGSVKMKSVNAATNAAWIPITSSDGTVYYVPGWTTNSP